MEDRSVGNLSGIYKPHGVCHIASAVIRRPEYVLSTVFKEKIKACAFRLSPAFPYSGVIPTPQGIQFPLFCGQFMVPVQ